MTTLEPTKRLESLDALRGLTIAAMLLVNNPGSWSSIYWPLEHAAWNGWTFTDLVFPFFLFMVGVAMMYSFPKRLAAGDSRKALFGHVVRRATSHYARPVVSCQPAMDGPFNEQAPQRKINVKWLIMAARWQDSLFRDIPMTESKRLDMLQIMKYIIIHYY